MDGTPKGVVKCTLSNWTGVVYKVPWKDLDKMRDRNDWKTSGIYFIFGFEHFMENPFIYVGQAGARDNDEGIYLRLKEHMRDDLVDKYKDIIVITTSNNFIGPTELCFLENAFYLQALKSKKFKVTNKNKPTKGNVTEEKESDLENFMEYAKLLTWFLGYSVFKESDNEETELVINKQKKKPVEKVQKYFCKRNGINTIMHVENGCYVLEKGSRIASEFTKSCDKTYKKKREECSSMISKDFILLEDISFDAISGAASFATGSCANGNIEFKTENSLTYKDCPIHR